MKFNVIELDGEEKVLYRKKPEKETLGELFKGHIDDIKAIQVNDKFIDDWQDYHFDKKDRITVYPAVGDFVSILVNILISVALSFLASLLAPKPKKPSAFKSQPSTGVAGIQNTIAPGTPKFLVYGVRRVFGHLIGSQVDLIEPVDNATDTGKKMNFKALYFMGVGQICCLSDVKINNTHIEDIDGPPEIYTRLGTQDQSVITGWKFCHQTYQDGRNLEIPLRPGTSKHQVAGPGQPITYTTKSSNVNQVTFFFQFPSGLWTLGVKGATYPNYVNLDILRKRNDQPDGYWTNLGPFQSVTTSTQDGFFWKITLDCPEADRWDFKINVAGQSGHGSFKSGPSMLLYNCMETMFIETAYPGNALLEVHGVGNSQITGFEQMETSALEEGRLVEVPNNGIFTKQCSRNRVWIIRDILLDAEVGLGNRIDPSLWDLASSQAAADYYEEDVTGFDGVTAQRDFCDVLLNEIRPGWDWLKILLFEGRACLIPSVGKWTYMLDVDKTPELLYSSPGNIIDETLQYQRGTAEKEVNTVKGEFPDEDNDFKVVPTKLVASNRGTDPERVEDVSYISLVRKSQVGREMNFLLKKKLLIKKRWNWSAPRSAVVSEPYDIDWLAYRTSKNLRGYSGLIDGGATTTRIPIAKSVYIASGLTYSVHIRQNNTVEERNLTNVAGNPYSVLTLSPALSFTPETGDIWAVGSATEHKVKIQTEEIEFDGENFKIVVHEHIPDVYDDSLFAIDNSGIVDITDLQGGTVVENPPAPLVKAQAGLTVQSGITVSIFTVVPSFNSFSGIYTAIGTNTIILASSEPNLDDFFNDTYLTADGEGPLHVLDYLGSSRTATVEDPGFLTASTTSGIYVLNWSGYSPFGGFRVEGSTNPTGPFSTTGITPTFVEGDTQFVNNTAFTPGTYSYIRFTPFNAKLEDNTNARWVTGIGTTDTTCPLPPVYVDITSDGKQVAAFFRAVAPVERDLQKASVNFYQNSPLTGATLTSVLLTDISNFRDDTATSRAGAITQDLGDNDYGDSIFAKVTTIDFFGNESKGAISILGTTLSATLNNDYTSIDIDDEETKRILTGTGVNAVCSMTVSGGDITPPGDAVRLDTLLTITPGSTASTVVNFGYSFGGVTVTTLIPIIANGVTKIPDDSPYWLTFILAPQSTTNTQIAQAFGYGEEVSGNILKSGGGTLHLDSNMDQILAVSSQASTPATITVHRSILRSILFNDNDVIPDAGIIPFTPGITQNWTGTPPTNVGDALDDLADSIGNIIGLTTTPNLTLLSNISGAPAIPTGNTISSIIDACISNVQGSILYRNASIWTSLPPGSTSSGLFLETQGANANPQWSAPSTTGASELIEHSVVTGSTGSFIFAATLDGNTDGAYQIVGRVKAGTPAMRLKLIPNAVTTNQQSLVHYRYSGDGGGATDAGHSESQSYMSLGISFVSSNYMDFSITFFAKYNPNGQAFRRTYNGVWGAGDGITTGTVAGVWSDTTTNITGFTIQSTDTSTGIGNGSEFWIYKMGG